MQNNSAMPSEDFETSPGHKPIYNKKQVGKPADDTIPTFKSSVKNTGLR